MSPTIVLFLLRLAGAVVLLAFLGLLFWFLLRDLRVARLLGADQATPLGTLRVIASHSSTLPVDTLIDLTPVTSIGRNSRNTITLDDNYISGEHALLSWRDTQWWLEDLGSRNGTLINDAPLTDPVVVSAGDVITLGEIRLKLETPERGKTGRGESGIRDSNP